MGTKWLLGLALAAGLAGLTGCGDDGTAAADAALPDGRPDVPAMSDGAAGRDARRERDAERDAWRPPEATIYVDLEIAVGECRDYDPASRSCGPGTAHAFQALGDAAQAAGPGDVVILRAGTYAEQLQPARSGTQDAPIVFAAQPGEEVVLTGPLRPAIVLSGLSHIVVAGLTVRQTARWAALDESHHCVLRDNAFLGATDEGAGSKSGIWLRRAEYNRIEGNRLEDNPEDAMALVDANRNVIQGNEFRNAGHALWAIRCGDENVVRGNFFWNDLEKIGEIYDCDGQSGVYDYDATKRNLVEENEFAYVPSSGNHSPYSGIQFAGQDTIVRRNIFHSTVGPGIILALYGQEARHNTGNRIYHNVFYGTDFAGLDIAQGDSMADNVLVNNIFAGSRFVANDTRWDWWVDVLDGKPIQVKTARLDAFRLETNCIYYDEASIGSPWLLVYGWRSPGWDEQHPISWWEANEPDLVAGTLEVDPGLVDPAGGDFRIRQDSPLVDAGAFLTHVRQTGSGTELPVEDARPFFDGYGIPGEVGDTIRLEGTETRAVVTAVDLASGTLTLDRPVEFTEGQGVALDYLGAGPDIGAHEVQ